MSLVMTIVIGATNLGWNHTGGFGGPGTALRQLMMLVDGLTGLVEGLVEAWAEGAEILA